ncbi:MAG TPA: proline iminopeptidase-family hydrolase [Rhizomicrobium sp.]|nr:proline iminopeptidase-family hydrolase [Rhizomicrobium sp.]
MAALASAPFLSAPVAARAAEPRIPDRTGYANVPGGRVWWRRLGEGARPPLLLLHGGPGMGHDYLLPLSTLATDRAVIFYDQLGCGRSDAPADLSLYTIGKFADRLDAFRAALSLDRVVLYGHSWGGFLAVEYLAARPRAGVEKLILSNTAASAQQVNTGVMRLIQAMPEGAELYGMERDGETDGSDYRRLSRAFYARHFCRLAATPPEFDASMKNAAASPATRPMVGEGITIGGNLRDWDRRAGLRAIAMPTLVVTGEFDEIAIDCHQTLRDGIAGARLEMMKGTSHMLMTEAPRAYNRLLAEFLA